MKTFILKAAFLSLIATLVGCSSETSSTTPISAEKTPEMAAVDGSSYLLDSEPEGAGNVCKVREEAANDDDVLIVGRIGGSSNPWIEGRAAFTIVDESLKACNDISGDNCPAPWDYCCETNKLPASTALVKIVDESGSVVKADAKSMLGIQELSTLLIKGKAKRDEAGNLTILASAVFVKQK
jgi:hypothetical protein